MTADQTLDAIIKIIEKAKKKQNRSFYMKMHKAFAPIVRFFTGVKTQGLENIPNEGGFLLCSNHIAVRDVILIGATCPRQIKFVAKKELFAIPVLSQFMQAMGAVKIDRSGNDVAALRRSIELIESGEIVSIFPQGHRFPAVDPSTTPIKNGAGMVAYRAGCDVLPVFIKVKGNKYGIFKRVVICYGKPIKHSELGFSGGGTDEYKAATELIFKRSLELGDYIYGAEE
jgi:1-acyl-sn-glycerol-3-phosphate acyltransferase